MSQMTDKTRPFVLNACINHNCNVVTFIKVDHCPECGELGVLLRYADWDRGAPRDLRSGDPNGTA